MSLLEVRGHVVESLENQVWAAVTRSFGQPTWSRVGAKVADELGWGIGDLREFIGVVGGTRGALFDLRS